jgi:diadenylate cyclase
VEGDRITRVNGVLPLTHRTYVPGFFGTRHRAAMGLAERSDALVVAVSEQRGQVTLFQRQDIHWVRDPDELVKMIHELHTGGREKFAVRLRRLLFANIPFKLTALGLASLVWSFSFFLTGTTVRTVTVPVEFSNVPAGTNISGQTVTELAVQLRGSPWLMESVNPDTLVAHFDLSNSKPGTIRLQVKPNDLDLPPGVVMDKVTPKSFSIRVTRESQ